VTRANASPRKTKGKREKLITGLKLTEFRGPTSQDS
jgi:hypothetical protein